MSTRTITLIAPAKFGGERRAPGWSGVVPAEIADELEAAGAIAAEGSTVVVASVAPTITVTRNEFEAEAMKRAKSIAETLVGPLVERATAAITAERDAAVVRAVQAEAITVTLEERVLELQGQLAASTGTDASSEASKSPAGDAPETVEGGDAPAQTQPAAKTARKGAAAKKG